MIPQSDEDAANVFGLCIFIVILISILSIPVIILFQKSFEELLKNPQIGQFFWLIPLSIVLSGAFQALNYWNTRYKKFHRLAIAQVINSGATKGIQLGVGIIGYASGGVLIGATIIGQFLSTLAIGVEIINKDLSFFKQNITWKGMANALKRFSNFPKYDIWSALLNAISGALPIFILTMYFNPTIVGYYALGLMVLQLPLSLIGSAVTQVFFQKAAEAKNYKPEALE